MAGFLETQATMGLTVVQNRSKALRAILLSSVSLCALPLARNQPRLSMESLQSLSSLASSLGFHLPSYPMPWFPDFT